jgi:S1-C subfamily serine protease
MLKHVLPGVVNISTTSSVHVERSPLFDEVFRQFFGMPGEPDAPHDRKVQSLGSGVIVDADRGLIVTTNHVIANAERVAVTLLDGRRFDATVVGGDKDTDVSVVRISARSLTALPFGDSKSLEVGDFVVAIGNPFGLGQTVTSGIVSALGRSGLGIGGPEGLIQTDASINPGNSGGALVDYDGQLIGINTAIVATSGGNLGIGFAIPANTARKAMDELARRAGIDVHWANASAAAPRRSDGFARSVVSGAASGLLP